MAREPNVAFEQHDPKFEERVLEFSKSTHAHSWAFKREVQSVACVSFGLRVVCCELFLQTSTLHQRIVRKPVETVHV